MPLLKSFPSSLDIFQIIAILLIVVIVLYLLFRFFQTQYYILGVQNRLVMGKEGFQEGLKTTGDDVSSMTLKDDGPGVTTVKYSKYPALTLKDYVVKTSYNTAYTGSSMSMKAITYVLTRGYRFLDFEIFMVDGGPVVGYSEDPKNRVITSSNTLPFGQVLYNVMNAAFSPPSPNSNDPLFIQLRIKTTDSTAFEMVAKAIDKNIKNRLYVGAVNGMTPIADLMGKIVLVIDKKAAPKYAEYPNCSKNPDDSVPCFNMSEYVNIEAGGDNLRIYKYSNLLDQTTNPPNLMDKDGTTDLTTLKMSYPDIKVDKGNPSLAPFYRDYGVQFVAVRLYLVDTHLKAYEKFFNDGGMAFLPFSVVLPAVENAGKT
jgi:hypothetical protein